ncbi:MAG: hypothetical protein NUV69_00305 [Candidatus Curtissbacteria bacterium]|nr:hypothetical protein [Candidatus Curtissbacteria bacterium]
MDKKTRLGLSFIGLSAFVLPVLLFVFFSVISDKKAEPEVFGERKIDTEALKEVAKTDKSQDILEATPSPITSPKQEASFSPKINPPVLPPLAP